MLDLVLVEQLNTQLKAERAAHHTLITRLLFVGGRDGEWPDKDRAAWVRDYTESSGLHGQISQARLKISRLERRLSEVALDTSDPPKIL